jgi:CelD/BcsL family acetyltransferase involved in cellulose biosynthesis
MNPSVPAFSTVTESSGFQSLREPWNALWASLDHPSLFSSFDWCWSTWRLVAERRGYKLRLVCGWLGGRLVLVWPMIEDSGVLRMLTSDTFEYRGIIVEPSARAPQWVEDAWSHVLATTAASTFFFQNLRLPNALSAKLSQMPNAKPIGGGWSPLVRLDRFADWDAYASTLPKSLVSDQRRQWKRVRLAMPGMSFRLVDNADAIGPVIDWIALHKAAWAEERGKRGWFNSDDTLVMLKSVAKSALDEGRLVLATLSDGNATMSAGWGFVCGGEFLFYAFAYDKAYATYSPSRLFVENLLQHCFRNGIRTFDFMPGDVRYKRVWATDYVRGQSYIGALNWRGALLLRLCNTRAVSGMPDALRDAYRILPANWRSAVHRRLRGYRMVNHALHLTLAPTAPPGAVLADGSSAQSDGDASSEHRPLQRYAGQEASLPRK